MKWQEYTRGIIGWSLFATMVMFWWLWFAADQSDHDYVVIGTNKLMLLILLINALLTAFMVWANNRDWR